MNIYIYVKHDTDMSCFDNIIKILKSMSTNIDIIAENRRSFRNFDILKNGMSIGDIIVVNDVSDLGLNNVDIANCLDWFIQKEMLLVINSISSTYMYGIIQPMNKAILSTLLQQIVSRNSNILTMNKKVFVGRNKIEFPDNWDELYEKWKKKEISSKEFIEESGLKKATFYNLLTEYRTLQQMNKDYIERYKQA